MIGVGRYEDPGIPRLRYTVPDAEAVYRTLIGPVGFKPEQVLLLTDRTEQKPTLRNIRWALGTFLARSARKDDTVLIFFAGHGAPEVDPRGLERDGLAKYLVPADADPDDLYSTALPMDELQTIFGRMEAERVVAFLDACYSGAAGGRTFAAKRTRARSGRPVPQAADTLEGAGDHHGVASVRGVARDGGAESRDVHVLSARGAEGRSRLNRDPIVCLQELYEYLEEQVVRKSRAVGGNQHPVMKGELEGPLPS